MIRPLPPLWFTLPLFLGAGALGLVGSLPVPGPGVCLGATVAAGAGSAPPELTALFWVPFTAGPVTVAAGATCGVTVCVTTATTVGNTG